MKLMINFLFLLLLFTLSLRAIVLPALVFSDNMVLQREQPLTIWGTANPGEDVMVVFKQIRQQTKAGTDRLWRVALPPLPASADPANLLIIGPENRICISNVLVGDLWLCAGQSNMEMSLSCKWGKVLNAEAEITQANFPLIRQFKVPHIISDIPLNNYHGSWSVCSPESVADFTAIGYFFAKEISMRTGVPIGIINASWGGSFIESWIPLPALNSNPGLAPVLERFQESLKTFPEILYKYNVEMNAWRQRRQEAQKGNLPFKERAPRYPRGGPLGQDMLAGIYNAMIHPFVTFPIKGILWYQGESNADRYSEYTLLFQTLITQWRLAFSNPDMPFYFVQLANFKTAAPWAFLRESQAQALTLPHTGMVISIDAGEERNIHPANKQLVAKRLAALALTSDYGIKVPTHGPVYKNYIAEGNSIRIYFDYADGLELRDFTQESTPFKIAGADQVFHPATVQIQGNSIVLSSEQVPSPQAARYAWSSNPHAVLYNSDNLPAAPFRTDAWKQ